MTFKVPEQFRVTSGPFKSNAAYGNNGAFIVTLQSGAQVYAIASDGGGWDHVSVSRTDRCPTWEEMCEIKNLFWNEDDCVVQYHPPKSDYINNHPHCLHLWRPIGVAMPRPPKIMVGLDI